MSSGPFGHQEGRNKEAGNPDDADDMPALILVSDDEEELNAPDIDEMYQRLDKVSQITHLYVFDGARRITQNTGQRPNPWFEIVRGTASAGSETATARKLFSMVWLIYMLKLRVDFDPETVSITEIQLNGDVIVWAKRAQLKDPFEEEQGYNLRSAGKSQQKNRNAPKIP
ncbi:hypothetical protein C8R43DRAFT_954157 [Mycena crocata]|nr:hypothetical protein C8R43DRAFT_954145 [Mycena crocata]KAJ7143381.1 hypothetical protein C8R43DRAFT_954157 [Mycena crocata]